MLIWKVDNAIAKKQPKATKYDETKIDPVSL